MCRRDQDKAERCAAIQVIPGCHCKRGLSRGQDACRRDSDKAEWCAAFQAIPGLIVIADCPDHDRQTILDWLSPLDFELTQAKLFHEWKDGSGNWFLESEQFKAWRDGTLDILWCPGIRELASYDTSSVFVQIA
jgi:hypothetical protein